MSPLSFDPNRADEYLSGLLPPEIKLAVTADDLPGVPIQPTVGPQVAALLDVLIRCRQPARILEIGSSFGYATCVMGIAAASYGGTISTVEIHSDLAEAARKNVASLGLSETIHVILGDAQEALKTLAGPFGLILQDGHKELYESLLDLLVERLEPGGLLISDDVLFPVMPLPDRVRSWGEAVARYNERLKEHPHLRTAWLPIGDGVAVSVKV